MDGKTKVNQAPSGASDDDVGQFDITVEKAASVNLAHDSTEGSELSKCGLRKHKV